MKHVGGGEETGFALPTSEAKLSQVERNGVEWRGVAWRGVAWSGVERSGAEWVGFWTGLDLTCPRAELTRRSTGTNAALLKLPTPASGLMLTITKPVRQEMVSCTL